VANQPPNSRPEPSDDALVQAIVEHLQASTSSLDSVHAAVAQLRSRATEAGASSGVVSGALSAARRLAKMKLDVDAVTAAILTPVITSFDMKTDELSQSYGAEVVELLRGVERIAKIRWNAVERESVEALRSMFVAIAQDVRVVLIVLAQRVELMRRLTATDDDVHLAQETLDVFAPLANRLGIWQFKWELEDNALRILQPDVYAELTAHLEASRRARQALIDEFIVALEGRIRSEGIVASIKGRPKHLYSIFNKMQRKQVSLDRIYDVSAVRVLVGSLQECYAVLGIVHSSWTPIQKEFDDYIAMPKGNGYQSLHTVVIGPAGRPFEVQIRTHEMHRRAELGVAAHWAYKEGSGKGGGRTGIEQDRFTLLRNLIDWEREVTDPKQMVESLRTDIFRDQVYVFTPHGKIIDLPAGATPIDFAYRVHTMVGHRCRGARVNDQIVSLDQPLKTGDRVEILTRKEPAPSRDWLNPELGFIKTSSARQKARTWFKEQGRENAIRDGKEIIARELTRLQLPRADLTAIAERLKYASVEDLQAAVGFGDRSSHSVGSTALQIERESSPDEPESLPPSVPPAKLAARSVGVAIDDVENVLGSRARCCNPVPGDNVVGFITRGRGVMIHRRDCPQVQDTREPERLVDLHWGDATAQRHTVFVEVEASERQGLVSELVQTVDKAGVDVSSAKRTPSKTGGIRIALGLECRSAEQLSVALDRLDKHPAVRAVHRRG
jgi:GTP pyrophosphokinase